MCHTNETASKRLTYTSQFNQTHTVKPIITNINKILSVIAKCKNTIKGVRNSSDSDEIQQLQKSEEGAVLTNIIVAENLLHGPVNLTNNNAQAIPPKHITVQTGAPHQEQNTDPTGCQIRSIEVDHTVRFNDTLTGISNDGKTNIKTNE